MLRTLWPSILLLLLPLQAEAARLQVFPGDVTARPGDRLRFVVLLMTGAPGQEQAVTPPQVRWEAGSGAVSAEGVYVVPPEASEVVEVKARVGSMLGAARVRVQRSTLTVYPSRVRIAPGHAIRFTVLDTRGGGARTPVKVEWKAQQGTMQGDLYRAPGHPGPDTVRVKLGDREAYAHVEVTGGKATPPPPRVPWRIKNWIGGGGLTRRVTASIEVLAPTASLIKALGSGPGRSNSVLASRRCKQGDVVRLEFTCSPRIRTVEVILYGSDGKILARQRRSP